MKYLCLLLNVDIILFKRTFNLIYLLVLLIYSAFNSSLFFLLENSDNKLSVNDFIVSYNLTQTGFLLGLFFIIIVNRTFKKKIYHRFLLHQYNNNAIFLLIIVLLFIISSFSIIIYLSDNFFTYYFNKYNLNKDQNVNFVISIKALISYFFITSFYCFLLLFLYLLFKNKFGYAFLFLVMLHIAEKLLYRTILSKSQFDLPIKSAIKFCSSDGFTISIYMYFLFFSISSFLLIHYKRNWL